MDNNHQGKRKISAFLMTLKIKVCLSPLKKYLSQEHDLEPDPFEWLTWKGRMFFIPDI